MIIKLNQIYDRLIAGAYLSPAERLHWHKVLVEMFSAAHILRFMYTESLWDECAACRKRAIYCTIVNPSNRRETCIA